MKKAILLLTTLASLTIATHVQAFTSSVTYEWSMATHGWLYHYVNAEVQPFAYTLPGFIGSHVEYPWCRLVELDIWDSPEADAEMAARENCPKVTKYKWWLPGDRFYAPENNPDYVDMPDYH
jgi:hypothetical protein